MKKILVLFSLVSLNSFAIQHYSCFPKDAWSTDRVVISLEKDHQQGTLFLSSGIQDDGTHDHSPVMPMSFIQVENKTNIYFAENEVAEFKVYLPQSSFDQNLDDVEIKLLMKNQFSEVTQNLNCYTRMYTDPTLVFQ